MVVVVRGSGHDDDGEEEEVTMILLLMTIFVMARAVEMTPRAKKRDPSQPGVSPGW